MNRLWASCYVVVASISVVLVGCPAGNIEDAGTDAFERIRRDGGPTDAFVEQDTPDAFVRGLDAGPLDAGPISQCEGVPAPETPCAADQECTEAGFARCAFPTVSGLCPRCGAFTQECLVDDDCVPRDAGPEADATFPDANEDAAREDAGVEDSGPSSDAGMDAGRDAGDAGRVPLVCVTYQRACACPRRVCEPRCTGPTCPDAQCDRDGYVCPRNSVCAPTSGVVNDHGCAPRRCTTTADCECGYCSPGGLCANGAGTCVI